MTWRAANGRERRPTNKAKPKRRRISTMYLHRSERRAPAIAVILLAASLGLGMTVTAHADVNASRACRNTIAKEFQKVVKTGLKNADKCNKDKDKACTAGSNRGLCNIVSPPS